MTCKNELEREGAIASCDNHHLLLLGPFNLSIPTIIPDLPTPPTTSTLSAAVTGRRFYSHVIAGRASKQKEWRECQRQEGMDMVAGTSAAEEGLELEANM
jgi:hypothetical protein